MFFNNLSSAGANVNAWVITPELLFVFFSFRLFAVFVHRCLKVQQQVSSRDIPTPIEGKRGLD